MFDAFNKELYKEYVDIVSRLGVAIPPALESAYKTYINKQMKDLPYVDKAVQKMYTLVFFLKYVKQMEGTVKFKDVYSKLEVQKKLISRAMDNVDVSFKVEGEHPIALEDWSSLYSITMGIGAGIKDIDFSQVPKISKQKNLKG
ncbi:hypothetical protein NEHOM01_2459 [Nematocida homosporus]|uniref:uncharacterized protein n=1 Tax=Nematocida homosporus TaxID=1912981 RepID=UPI00221EFFAB|nr:uncharacterized protein NEHOM01_2459 [Nematocida homosporus]KAI5187942.1 hypothetical protein NEHOM01_2459 [Nematocida homosporus]